MWMSISAVVGVALLGLAVYKWKRSYILAGLAMAIVVLPLIRYGYQGKFTFSSQGRANTGYTILPSGRLKQCAATAGTDQSSGQPCLPLTPVVKQVFEEATGSGEKAPQIFVDNPEVFFNPNPATGKPQAIIWHCERGDGQCHFARIPIRDPVTGELCKPVTPEMAKRAVQGQQRACENADEQAMRKLTPLPIRAPFLENFEDGRADGILFSEGWKFDNLPSDEKCVEGKHCVCVQKQGSFQLPLEMLVSWSDTKGHFSFQLFGQGLRLVVKTRDQAGYTQEFVHNMIVGDASPSSWAQGSAQHSARIPPVHLTHGWQRVSLYVSGRNLQEQREPRRSYEEPVYSTVRTREPCSLTDFLADALPFVDDCDNGYKPGSGWERQQNGYKTVEDPGRLIFQGEVVAQLAAQGFQGNVWLTPELILKKGVFAHYQSEQGNSPDQLAKLQELYVQIIHPYDGTICLDELELGRSFKGEM